MRTGVYAVETTKKLEAWLFDHVDYPYPSIEEKNKLCRETGLNLKQINDWMSNSRRRKLKKVRYVKPTKK